MGWLSSPHNHSMVPTEHNDVSFAPSKRSRRPMLSSSCPKLLKYVWTRQGHWCSVRLHPEAAWCMTLHRPPANSNHITFVDCGKSDLMRDYDSRHGSLEGTVIPNLDNRWETDTVAFSVWLKRKKVTPPMVVLHCDRLGSYPWSTKIHVFLRFRTSGTVFSFSILKIDAYENRADQWYRQIATLSVKVEVNTRCSSIFGIRMQATLAFLNSKLRTMKTSSWHESLIEDVISCYGAVVHLRDCSIVTGNYQRVFGGGLQSKHWECL